MKIWNSYLLIFFLIVIQPLSCLAQDSSSSRSASAVVRSAIEYWRSDTSIAIATMVVHRPAWERTMKMKSWTEGTNRSLIKFLEPAKDAGSASLKDDATIWTFSPKINRAIKIPASMMSQSWMGSDFSYNDLARGDDILEYYTHRFLPEQTEGNHKVFVIEAIPDEDSPIVWGKEILKIRDDSLLLAHEFYDQDLILVKRLETLSTGIFDGKVFPKKMRMYSEERQGEWTEIIHNEIRFQVTLPKNLFTLSYLKNPRLF